MNPAGGDDPLRVLHVITGLNVGGAETVHSIRING